MPSTAFILWRTMFDIFRVPDEHPEARAGIICPEHGHQGLTPAEYKVQLGHAEERWRCPLVACGRVSLWDDDRYDRPEAP